MSLVNEEMNSKYSARKTAQAGLIYQSLCGLLHFLQMRYNNNNLSVRFEILDDIEFILDGTVTGLGQIKHHGCAKEDRKITNFSEDIWNTIGIWIDYIISHDASAVNFYFITTQEISDKSFFLKLVHGINYQDKHEIINLMNEHCHTALQKEYNNEKKKEPYNKFLNLTDYQKELLITRLKIIANSPNLDNIDDEIKKYLQSMVGNKKLNEAYRDLKEWWVNRVNEQITSGSINPITLAEFELKEEEIRNKYSKYYLTVEKQEITSDLRELYSHYRFSEQLQLIGATHNQIMTAVDEFYFANGNRVRWVDNAELLTTELDKYDNELKDECAWRFDDMEHSANETSDDAELAKHGYDLYQRCQSEINVQISPTKTVDGFMRKITRGSLHILAGTDPQEDDVKIGWHPQFRERLTKVTEESN